MRLGISKGLTWLVLLTIFTEFISIHFVKVEARHDHTVMLQKAHVKSDFAAFLFEIEEEEERDAERDKFTGGSAADHSKFVIHTIRINSPFFSFVSHALHLDVKTPLFKLFCVFLI